MRLYPRLRLAPTSALAFLLLAATTACNTQPGDVLGYAFIAPGTLNLRRELSQKNATVAVLKHGERVQILEVRRRFVRIRTEQKAEGWADSSQLLTPEQMAQIRSAAEHALALPSEGSATVFEALNIHLEPSRLSPVFARIPETGSVEVLAHRIEAKATGPPPLPVFTFDRPQTSAHRDRRDRKSKPVFKLPSPPPPPKAPSNWQELSVSKVNGGQVNAGKFNPTAPRQIGKSQEAPKTPAVFEDWSLVRMKDKQCGWVLSRNLIMSIPDEVAQYAEGKRITSFFDLGSVTDEVKGVKHNWLWTTLSETASYDFNSWRVFLWNRRRHRYETSYRERDLEGYYPVHVDAPDASTPQRTFQIVIKGDDGKFWRSSYFFDGVRVHLTGREPYQPGAGVADGSSPAENAMHLKTPQAGWFSRHLQSLRKQLTGRN